MKPMMSQKGSVLLVSLIFLLLLTLVGVSSMNMTSLEEQMAGNFRDHDLAFQAAEAALLAGEEFVEDTFDITQAYTSPACSGAICYTSSGTAGLSFNGALTGPASPVANCDSGTTKEWEDSSIWSDSSKTRASSGQISGTVENARYIVEFRCFMPRDSVNLDPDPDVYAQWSPAFRITAVASGTSTDSTVMLQSIYKLVN
jgi:type IV pilus assembly protein PilX